MSFYKIENHTPCTNSISFTELENVALGKGTWQDSTLSSTRGASSGAVDGSPSQNGMTDACIQTASSSGGHTWMVNLGVISTIMLLSFTPFVLPKICLHLLVWY